MIKTYVRRYFNGLKKKNQSRSFTWLFKPFASSATYRRRSRDESWVRHPIYRAYTSVICSQ